MPVDIQGLVTDQRFMQLSPEDQQSTLAQADSRFGRINPDEFQHVVTQIQRQAIANPANAPAMAKDHVPMMNAPLIGSVPDKPSLAYPDVTQPTTALGMNVTGGTDTNANKAPMPGATEGANAAEGLAEWDDQSFGNMGRGVADVAQGDIAKGGHEVIQGVGAASVPVLPFAAPAAPAQVAGGLIGAGVSQQIGQVVGKHLGLNDDQTNLLSDLFALAGGYGGAKGAGALEGAFSNGATVRGGVAGVRGGTAEPVTGISAEDAEYEPPIDFQGGDKPVLKNQQVIKENELKDIAAKSGLPEGEAASSTPPSGEDIQPNLRLGIRSVASQTSKDAGLEAVPPAKVSEPQSVRDSFGSVARNVISKAQSDFKALDEASGGRWQRFSDQIKNIQEKMGEVNGIDDDAYENLEAKRNELQTLQAQMVEDMKASGKIDPAIADRANAQYRRGMALQDVNNAVRMSTKPSVTAPGKVEDVINPDALANRLSKLNDTPPWGGDSRLVQALGKDGAADLINHVQEAQSAKAAVESFKPTSATGQKAMADLLRPVTEPKLIRAGIEVNYIKAYADFTRMTPEQQAEMFGNETPQAAAFLRSRARAQANWLRVGKVASWVTGGLGLLELAHKLGI